MNTNSPLQGLTAAYFTLGCKLNFAETSTIAHQLEQEGVRKVRAGEHADICIVNTCSVTEVADHKCRQAIHKLVRQHPGAFVIVMGCYAQLKPDEVAAIPGVSRVLSQGEKGEVVRIVKEKYGDYRQNESRTSCPPRPTCPPLQPPRGPRYLKETEASTVSLGSATADILDTNPVTSLVSDSDASNINNVRAHANSSSSSNTSVASSGAEGGALGASSSLSPWRLSPPRGERGAGLDSSLFTLHSSLPFTPSCSCGDRTRYFLKVQDGCNYFCTYCTIPFARGRSRNGSIASLVEQARQAAADGGKEIVITGVNIGDFGRTTGESFLDLLQALDQVEGIERYRISSIEPNLLTDEVLQFCAQSRAFMPHFHIPLQSGSDEVLRLMHRRYDTTLFYNKVARVRELMPDAFIGVDVIVGTRGETAELFDEAERFIQSLPISQLHVFSYSERPGTAALRIPHVVRPEEKHERSQRLLAISEEKLHAFYSQYIGSTRPVLLEHSRTRGLYNGFTDNYIKVAFQASSSSLDNQLLSLRLMGWNDDNTALVASQS